MAEVLDVISIVALLGAAALAALSGLGVVGFRELLPRMHSLTMASTGATTLAVIGTAFALRSTATSTTLVLVLALQLFTFPVGANLVARAVSKSAVGSAGRRSGPPDELSTDQDG